MKRLLATVFTASLFTLIVSVFFYRQVDKVIPATENPVKGTVDFLDTDTTRYDIIFIGSSRILMHVNPAIIDSVCGLNTRCLALDGATIPEELIMLKKYMQLHAPPKMIVLGLDYATLWGSLLPYDYPDYYEFMDDPVFDKIMGQVDVHYRYKYFFRHYDSFIRKSARTDYQKFSGLSASIGFKVKSDDLNDIPSWLAGLKTYKGYLAINVKWTQKAEEGLQYVNTDFRSDARGIAFFDDFIKTSKGYAAKTVVIFTPSYAILSKSKSAEVFLSKYNNMCTALGVPFWNYNNDTICSSKAYFSNELHLNKTGSDLFSGTLAKDINNYFGVK